jgi:DNA-binding transcriptional regulator GbsR (MarR family)
MSAERALTRRPGPDDWQEEFLQRVAAWADVSGLPPSYIQVFAWLVVCEPPEQSVDELRDALGLSAGAISMATAALSRMGVVERIAQPGIRRRYYRFHARGWERVLRLRLEAVAHIRAAAEHALASAPRPQDRLSGMRDVYASFEEQIAKLLAGSSAHRSVTGPGDRHPPRARGR